MTIHMTKTWFVDGQLIEKTIPEETIYDPNFYIEYCKSYAEQLRDKTRANRAEHAADCIEYLLRLVQKEWQGLTDDEINNFAAECQYARLFLGNSVQDAICKAAAKLKEKNNG